MALSEEDKKRFVEKRRRVREVFYIGDGEDPPEGYDGLWRRQYGVHMSFVKTFLIRKADEKWWTLHEMLYRVADELPWWIISGKKDFLRSLPSDRDYEQELEDLVTQADVYRQLLVACLSEVIKFLDELRENAPYIRPGFGAHENDEVTFL